MITIQAYFENQEEYYIHFLQHQQPTAIKIIQDFVEEHNQEGLFVDNGGVEIFNYMDDSVGICFHQGGTGDCVNFYQEISFDTGESFLLIPIQSPYELTDYSAKEYLLKEEKHRIWKANMLNFWVLDCWQRAGVNDKVPFAFFNDYYDNFYFDLLTMRHVEHEEWSRRLTAPTLQPIELKLQMTLEGFYAIFLQKETLFLEIGYTVQGKNKQVYERQYRDGKWQLSKNKMVEKNPRNLTGDFLHRALKEGFKAINLPESVKYEQPLAFILPANFRNQQRLWETENAVSIADFEAQFNIQLPKDYRSFLETYNGFQTHGYYGFGYDIYDSVRPILFYGLTEKQAYDLRHQIEKLRYQSLPDFIPIGEDLDKNQIWLGVSAKSQGQIIYQRKEVPAQKTVTYQVGNSFQSFVNEFFFDVNVAIEHIVGVGDLGYFKNYVETKWNWDDALRYKRDALDVIMRSEPLRPEFLDFALSQGQRVDKLLNNGYYLSPEYLAIFEKHQIDIPKIVLSQRLNRIVLGEKPIDEVEFNNLIAKGANIQVLDTYETLERYLANRESAERLSAMGLIKPHHQSLDIGQKIALIIDQKGLIFKALNHEKEESSLAIIEVIPAFNLPPDWHYFISKYQNTSINIPYFRFTIRAGNDQHFEQIDHFLSLSKIVIAFGNVKKLLQRMDITTSYLPIGITENGGYILVNCEKDSEKYGAIAYLYNHIIRYSGNKGFEPYQLQRSIAINLKYFLQGLLPTNHVFDKMSLAAQQGDISYFKKRLAAGWNINVYTRTEQTVLHQAVRNNQHDLAGFLLANGANPNLRVALPDGGTALNVAMKYGDERMVRLIFEKSDLSFTPDFEKLKWYLVSNYGKGYLAQM